VQSRLKKLNWKRLEFRGSNITLEIVMGKGMEHRAGSVMVVGAGIAGIQAALDLTELGYYVYLVEKSPVIGGVMSQLDKTFPTNDCSI